MSNVRGPNFSLIAPPHTPFHPDGRLNTAPVALQAEWLSHSSVDGVFVAGSTGESLSLTVDERKELADKWIEVGPTYGLKVFVHVGHNSQLAAIELAKHARRSGAHAIAVMAPSFFKPTSVDQLVDFLQPISTACSDLPLYYYDIPGLTGVNLSTLEFLRIGGKRLPNLAGVKFTNPDLAQLQECIGYDDGRYEIYFGTDEALIAGYALGACGAIGSTYNFVAPHYRQLIAHMDQGELSEARQKQLQAVRLCQALSRISYISACKQLMKRLGIDLGPVRPPVRNLLESEAQQTMLEIEALDVFATKIDNTIVPN